MLSWPEKEPSMTLPLASIQLYSLADEFATAPRRSLDKLAALGLQTVEAFDFVRRPMEIRAALDGAGLAAPTGHAPLLSDELWTPGGVIPTPPPEVVFEAAATVGITTVIDPYVAVDRWLTEDGVADLAERLNAAAQTAASFGLRVGYHNHAQEFVVSFDGEVAFERFVSLTDENVEIELDLFWALAGRQDVPALVSRLGSRLVAVHIKDGVVPKANPFAPDAPAFDAESLDQRHAGAGDVPLADALHAGVGAIRYAVIEYDNPPGDIFEDVGASLAFLRNGGFVQ